MIDSNIFRAYDLRGIYPDQLNEKTATIIGKSFGSYAINHNIYEVIVGYDNRLSSQALEEALINGLTSTGIKVVKLGLITTPMFYYARIKLNIWAGLMITASHNPKEYNGFKISLTNIGNLAGEEIEQFRDFTFKNNFISGKGEVSCYDIRNDYLELIKKSLQLGPKKIKVVVDCGNGTCSTIVKELFDNFPIEYDLLYCESNGNFPNHHPDPSVSENLKDLQKRVIDLGYDLGIAVDADGDRVRVVNEFGNIVNSDVLMIIFYRNLNPILKNRLAIFDVKCSKALIDELKILNIKPLMWRTGNSYLYRKTNQENVDFAGEYSGHIFFRDRFPGIDDGLYAGLRLIEILSKTNETVSHLYQGINHYYATDEIKTKVTEESKFHIIAQIKEYAINMNYEFIDIDGIRINFTDGWALIRASNTGPDLTTRYEALTEKRLNEIKKEFSDLVDQIIKKLN